MVASLDADIPKKFTGLMSSHENSPADRLVQRLKLLVFFHLGADATLNMDLTKTGLHVSIGHSRVDPFDLDIPCQELEMMTGNLEKVEELFLELLVKNRRG